MNETFVKLTLSDICEAVALPEEVFVELIENDIISPRGSQPSEWSFDFTMVCIAKQATRLHRDLELDWEVVALIMDLLDEREKLQSENKLLRQRLQRFLLD